MRYRQLGHTAYSSTLRGPMYPRRHKLRCVKAKTADCRSQGGFTLVELLVALAITGVVMAILIQSIQSHVDLSARITRAAEQSVEEALDYQRFQSVIRGLISAWPEEEQAIFRGDSDGFSGLTRRPMSRAADGLVHVRLTLETRRGVGVIVQYADAAARWPVAEFPGADGGAMAYLGADGVWQPAWPPAENPDPGGFGDAAFYATPQVPVAIRLTIDRDVWVAPIGTQGPLPLRARDALAGFN